MSGRVRRAGGLIALAACGSGSHHASKTAAKVNSSVKFAECVRSHGYSKFPDPGSVFPPGIKQSPAFEKAFHTCLKLEPQDQSTGSQLSAAQRATALAQVRCIRARGIANFPDPTFPAGGGELLPASPGFSATSPAFRRAAAVCGLRGSSGQPHGG